MEWVKAGGTWIVGPMSDIMDGNVRKYTDAPYSFLEEAAGVGTLAQELVANDTFTAKWADGTPCSVGTCYDAYVCRPGTKSLAVYDKGELSGLSAIAERTVGKGKIVLVGSVLSAADLLRLVGLPPIAEASGNVMLVERSGKVGQGERDHRRGDGKHGRICRSEREICRSSDGRSCVRAHCAETLSDACPEKIRRVT